MASCLAMPSPEIGGHAGSSTISADAGAFLTMGDSALAECGLGRAGVEFRCDSLDKDEAQMV